MCKKRKIITITVLFVLGVAVSYLQWGREIDVVGSMGTSSENFHEEHVTFTLNRLIITDKEKCAEEIIKKCRENDFAWDIGHYDTIIRLEEINLLPFQSEGIMTYVLNIIMFLPLGFLIPLIWKRYRNPLKIFMIGFGFSLSIELCQLFNRRNTDIDDLMMNTLGAVIGYFIWKLTKRLFKNINHKSISLSKLEPIVYLTLAVLGEFLLFNWRIFL